MRQLLKAFGRPRRGTNSAEHLVNTIRPDTPFTAIGDIHGRADLLDDLLARLNAPSDQPLIFVGDYVDRGPESAAVLARLFEMQQAGGDQVVCLMGNHEKMLCEFVDDPLGKGARWLVNGGLDTLQSFGVSGLSRRPDPDDAMRACEALEQAMPDGMLSWLRNLPLSWQSGNVWCVHAAMDVEKDPEAQRSRTLLWGHESFLEHSRNDDICVVHGHTIVDAPFNGNSRISIDTGAYFTGNLTAAQISDGQCVFVTT
ncbi:metallophosphoesterase [Yoonia sp. SS1-5]|uniref:Metallophosphoesterase n=1 Tax=Yoonia rhodophyticola TaxID=3137370 RepID=A0AAN0MBR4_9RHOB